MDVSRSVTVPVRVFPDERKNVAVVGVVPENVVVSIRGSREDMETVRDEALCVDLRPSPAAGVASEDLVVRKKDVMNLSKNVRIDAIAPSKVSVEYDFMWSSEATDCIAKPQLVGLEELRGSARIAEASMGALAGRKVTIYGSRKSLLAFTAKGIRLPTDPVNVEGKTESFEAVVAIRPPADSGITKVEPERVPVRVEIEIEKDPDSESIRVKDPVLVNAPEEPAKSGTETTAPGPADEEPAGTPDEESAGDPVEEPAGKPAEDPVVDAPPSDGDVR